MSLPGAIGADKGFGQGFNVYFRRATSGETLFGVRFEDTNIEAVEKNEVFLDKTFLYAWHHYCVTYQPGAFEGKVSLFVDGMLLRDVPRAASTIETQMEQPPTIRIGYSVHTDANNNIKALDSFSGHLLDLKLKGSSNYNSYISRS